MDTWLWPSTVAKTITSRYGMRTLQGKRKMHKGIDISGSNVRGTPVLASQGGNVTTASFVEGYGNAVYIDHGNGFTSRYAHMDRIDVKSGQQVVKGQQIGLLGNTGHSTGPHLHFEIRVNGEHVNPEPYLNPNMSITEPTVSVLGSDWFASENSPSSWDTNVENSEIVLTKVPYTNKYVSGVRVSDTTEQPLHSFISISVGDVTLTTKPSKPNLMMSLEFVKLEEAGSSGNFTIFDDNWEDIEVLLAEHWNNINVQYGYADDTGNPVESKSYSLILQNYTVKFNLEGVILSVDFFSEGLYMNLATTSVDTNTKNPTEAIKAICRSMGVSPSGHEIIVKDENFAITKDCDREENFKFDNENPVTYIVESIVPEASNAEERKSYRFYIDEHNVAYLKEIEYRSPTKTYVYQRGYDSSVLDLTFDMKGTFGGTTKFQIASSLSGNVWGTTEKRDQAYSITIDPQNTVSEIAGPYLGIASNQSTPLIDSTGDTEDQTKRRLYYHVRNSLESQYTAQMVILGDPSLELFQTVWIINLTDNGTLHHTSGIYRIISIIDSLEGGNYVTSLKLVRNADSVGATENMYDSESVSRRMDLGE